MSMEDYAANYGFSVSRRAGQLIFFSGQVGTGPTGEVPSNPAEQYSLAFEALRLALSTEGCIPADLVELLTFHVDYPQHMEDFVAAKAKFLGNARPTWTAIGVANLGAPGTLVEIKAVALAKT